MLGNDRRKKEGALIKLIDTRLHMANVDINQEQDSTRVIHMTGADLYMKDTGLYGRGTKNDEYFTEARIENE